MQCDFARSCINLANKIRPHPYVTAKIDVKMEKIHNFDELEVRPGGEKACLETMLFMLGNLSFLVFCSSNFVECGSGCKPPESGRKSWLRNPADNVSECQ